MIKEFALEPGVLATWESFRYYIEKFGVSQGRVISRFPKDWKRLVYEAAQKVLKGTKQLAQLEVRLKAIGDDILLNSGRPGGDATKTWLERAIAENARQPFAGIIASSNPGLLPYVLLHGELDDQDARFRVPTQLEVQRTAVGLVGCAELILRHTRTVKWVDYKIDPSAARWNRPLREAIRFISASGQEVTLEVHREWDVGSETQKANLVRQFREGVEAYRGQRIRFELHLRPEKVMHDRFILTDRGGILIGQGLDDNEDGGNAPTANVILLESGIFRSRWEQFSAGAAYIFKLDP